MIYSKDAVFPYPVLSETSNSYQNNYFTFDVDDVKEDAENYIFIFSYEVGSPFIYQLLREKKAALIFIIQSDDNIFEEIPYDLNRIVIKKSRLSLKGRTKIQLQIQSKEQISFEKAADLNNFFNDFKDKIVIKRHNLLGYSEETLFEGSKVKPLELFEQTIREDLPIPFGVELRPNTINLLFRSREESLEIPNVKKGIRNMYIYVGLDRALSDFVNTYIQENDETVDLMNLPTIDNGLHLKLKELMLNKNITEIDSQNIDQVIQNISDKLVEKFSGSIREMSFSGD
ncbi:hypothetical protein QUW13_10660 [Enterococcus hirae]|nr:hypothetical protein [Enterococcus hirae]